MVFLQQCPVESDERLPLLVRQPLRRLVLLVYDIDALPLHHHQSCIDALHLVDKLLLGDRASGRLPHQDRLWRRQDVRMGRRRVVDISVLGDILLSDVLIGTAGMIIMASETGGCNSWRGSWLYILV